jgi:hypothetical protein
VPEPQPSRICGEGTPLDKEKCRAFLRAQKNVAEKNRIKGISRLRFFVARAAEGGEAVTALLCAGFYAFIIPTLFIRFCFYIYFFL